MIPRISCRIHKPEPIFFVTDTAMVIWRIPRSTNHAAVIYRMTVSEISTKFGKKKTAIPKTTLSILNTKPMPKFLVLMADRLAIL